MKPRNTNYARAVREIFEHAPFIEGLGLRVAEIGPGWCETELDLRPRHLQQHGFVHAGVQAAVADHTAGAAGTTLVGEGEGVLSVEFKVNLLRPARGDRLLCRGTVLRGGRTLIVAESEVWADDRETRNLVAKATVTLAVRQLEVRGHHD